MRRYEVAQRMWDFISSSPPTAVAEATYYTNGGHNAEVRSIAEACNAAIQEITHYAPRDFWKETRSAVLRPPESAVIDVTEDSKTFTKLRGGASFSVTTDSSSNITATAHPMSVGDRIRFTEGTPPTLEGKGTYYVTSTTADTFKVSATRGGSPVTNTGSASFSAYKALPEIPEGCSIEIDGEDEVLRISSATEEGSKTVSTTASDNDITLTDINDLDSWQWDLKVGDTVRFSGAAPGNFNQSTTYYVIARTKTGAYPHTHSIKIRLSASEGGGQITPNSTGSFKLYRYAENEDIKGTLTEEYLGTTGTKTCTVYYDAVKLNSKVIHVLGSVTLDDESVLTPLMNDDQSSRMHRDRLDQSERFGEYGSGWELPSELQDKKGTPSYYFLDSEHDPTTLKQNYYLRVRPFPEKKARLRFNASILPDRWSEADVSLNSNLWDYDGTRHTGCPAGYEETVLMPFVYKNFVKFIGFDVMPSEGSLQSGNILLQIDEDYRQAIEILKELEPQSERQPLYSVAW